MSHRVAATAPVWQKDSDASNCFICDSAFNLFYRRHHCRKCGRVVCGDCSAQTLHYFDNTPISTQPGSTSDFSSGSTLNSSVRRRAGVSCELSKPNEVYRTCDECAREILMIRRVLFNSPDSQFEEENRGNIKHSSTRERTRQLRSTSSTPSTPSTPSLDVRANPNTLRDNASDGNLCPVCASDLLKEYIAQRNNIEAISNHDFENFKEEHISECLTKFDFNTNKSTRFSPDSNPRNKMLVYNIPPIPEPQYENIDRIGEAHEQEEAGGRQTPPEKEEGDECVVCLEEFKPGDKVGRLECLCVFHYKCIKDWFNKKGYGECPVHFLHK
ncbi:uncharacterized protein LODBEIA_P19160 [Lodderomyces beijingensis]|uniref:RING-type E3 ubiquitin transferase n=1 Tax=Lodderomyces beijingensis TaxID=1775926 RepID=A0ABP0ZHP8_9ASCO